MNHGLISTPKKMKEGPFTPRGEAATQAHTSVTPCLRRHVGPRARLRDSTQRDRAPIYSPPRIRHHPHASVLPSAPPK
jgi:hypothetical protein